MFDLLRHRAPAAPVLDAASDLLGADLRSRPETALAGRLSDNRIAQPLICAAAIGAWQVLRPLLPAPVFFAGCSIGELAAHGCGGAGRYAGGQGVAAAGHRDAVSGQWRRDRYLQCGGSIRHRGPAEVLAAAAEAALGRGARLARRLQVNVISHTSRLQTAGAAFAAALEAAPLAALARAVLAGIDAAPGRMPP